VRRNLEAVCLFVLAVQLWITYRAINGPARLPDRIPTHFDMAGNPNGWGSPAMLLLLPVVSLGIYLLITAAAQFPSAFNYPVRVTAQNRAQLQALALAMIAWLKVEVLVTFSWIQWATIQAARHVPRSLSPALMPIALVAVFGTIAWFVVAMFRAARNPSGA